MGHRPAVAVGPSGGAGENSALAGGGSQGRPASRSGISAHLPPFYPLSACPEVLRGSWVALAKATGLSTINPSAW